MQRFMAGREAGRECPLLADMQGGRMKNSMRMTVCGADGRWGRHHDSKEDFCRRNNTDDTAHVCGIAVLVKALCMAVMFLAAVHAFSISSCAAGRKPAAGKEKGRVRLLVANYDSVSVPQAKNLFVRAGALVDTTTCPAARINVSQYDGLIVPGSVHDVVPAYYGQKNTHSWDCFKQFDIYRFKVIRKFVLAGKPVYGICGGIQSINVLFGGTLKQHIDKHSDTCRTVRIAKESINYKKFGPRARTYHCHHQCPDQPAPGFTAVEWDAADGHIEALQHTKYPIYGVQYHPEFMGRCGDSMARTFVSICRKYRNHPYDVREGDLFFIKF